MEKIANFFEHIQSWQRVLFLVGGILLFWIIEGIIPLFRFDYKKVHHAGLNLVFTATTAIVNLVFAFLIVMASNYTNKHGLGLLHLFKMPLWLFILSGLLLLDFIGAWLIHWLQHKIKWMWKFHTIHHADTWVDTTTANRHHPGESLFRIVFALIATVVTGAPMWLFFLYQFLSVLVSQFSHANISLPKWIDRLLSWVIVSPDMHKVHHHYAQPLTDTNYGNIFAIWDRIFGTFAEVKDTRDLKFGLDIYLEEQDHNKLSRLMSIPFDEYRPPPGSKFSTSDS